jgi:allophanate hydrolase
MPAGRGRDGELFPDVQVGGTRHDPRARRDRRLDDALPRRAGRPESTGLCLDRTTLSALYAAGATTPSEIVRIVYRRIPEYLSNPIWITLRREEDVLGEALALEARGPDRGPLYGLPFAVKDKPRLRGTAYDRGLPGLHLYPRDERPCGATAPGCRALLIGKTNLDQLATGLTGTRSPYGACRNLFDDRYIAGGSSSGSARSVAAGLVSFALGTDTAGSGRVPAAFNNIVGLKPTPGLVGTRGLVPACRSLDCVSIFAVSSADALAVLRVLAGYDAEDPYSRPDASVIGLSAVNPPASFRFGIPRELEFFGDGEAERLFHAALRRLETLGGRPIEIDFAPYREAADSSTTVPGSPNASSRSRPSWLARSSLRFFLYLFDYSGKGGTMWCIVYPCL